MKKNREIIFIDETSTNMWDLRKRIWQPKDSRLPLVVQRANTKEKNVTIIGAVSLKMKMIYHHVTNSTNTITVEDFFKKMEKRVGICNKVIVMDNHAAHKSEIVTELLASKGAIVLFLPPSCSYFNPIETIWSWVKGKWRKLLLQVKDLRKRHYKWMPVELSNICKSCPEQVIHNIVKSCDNLMKGFL